MRKVVLVVCLMALGGVMLAGATSPQKLVLVNQIKEQVQPKVIGLTPIELKDVSASDGFTISIDKANSNFSILPAKSMPASKSRQILLSPVSVKIFQEADTLRYDDVEPGDQVSGVILSQGQAYVAMKFTPPKPCTLKGAVLGMIFQVTGNIGFPFCVWDDEGGRPGFEVVGPYELGIQGEEGYYAIVILNFEDAEIFDIYTDEDDFWVGFGIGADILGVACDDILDYPTRGAFGGGTDWLLLSEAEGWPAGDPVIRAIVTCGGGGPGVEETGKVSEAVMLEPNKPNPFTKETRIRFHIPNPGRASLKVYDITGKLVRSLIDEGKSAGAYEAIWDGKDSEGKRLAPGIYFCRLVAGEYTEVQKLIIVE